MNARIVLIGPRGCGKTTVGKQLAERLGVLFIDLDDRTLATFEEDSITAAWAEHGETAWRHREAAELRCVLDQAEPAVLALGGGTPTIDEVAELLMRRSRAGDVRVAYLHCPADVLAARLRQQPGDRPSLTGRPVADEIRSVLADREPRYRALSQRVMDATTPSGQIVDLLATWLEEELREPNSR